MKILIEPMRASKVHESRQNRPSDTGRAPSRHLFSSFRTPLGWMGLLGADEELVAVQIGHPTTAAIHAAVNRQYPRLLTEDWNPLVREMLEAYSEGEIVNFSSIRLQLPPSTRFQQLVLNATRQIPYGEISSYGDLARQVGHARAARAVGTVMSTNRFPIIIPCHRVLAAGGNIGGYSSPAGLDLKRRLLEIERTARETYLVTAKRKPAR